MPSSHDLLGIAALDFYNGDQTNILMLHNNYGPPEEMPIDILFQEEKDLDELQYRALDCCQGKILDIGAGTGSNALILEKIGCKVDAIEISPTMNVLMKLRGVKSPIIADVRKHISGEYDTLLLMMNGLGLAGTISELTTFLKHLKSLLALGGQIIADSSDISYLYEDIPMPKNKYFGEIEYSYEYKGEKGDWFPWLYVDQNKLTEICIEAGLDLEVIYQDDTDQYLVRMLPVLDS